MTDKPIIFSGPMVRALLEGRKTQTRRVLTMQNTLFDGRAARWPNYLNESAFLWSEAWVDPGPSPAGNPGPYLKLPVLGVACDPQDPLEQTVHRIYPRIQPGDRLYVREAWTARMTHGWTIADARSRMFQEEILYRADGHESDDGWWPSIHMPREFSRLTLTVTEVRVQRLQEISMDDARAEGCDAAMALTMRRENGGFPGNSRETFKDLWNSLHGADAWAANPWVVALTFTVQHGNIDQLGKA